MGNPKSYIRRRLDVDKTAKTSHKTDIHELLTNIHELIIHACTGAGGLTAGSLDRRQRAVIGQGRLRSRLRAPAVMNINFS